MVAIFSGNGLGVSNGSGSVLGQFGMFGGAAQGAGKEAAFVNAASGNLVLRDQDGWLAASGLNLALTRTYNSLGNLGAQNWMNGPAKRLTLSGAANQAGSSVTRTDEDGSVQVYRYDSALQVYRSTDGGGAHDVLNWNAGSQQWTWQDERISGAGLHETYDATGRLVAAGDHLGQRTRFFYDPSGRIASVIDGSGDTTHYDYDGSRLSRVRTVLAQTGHERISARYGYDGQNRLASVTVDLTPEDGSIADGKVYTTAYTYFDGGNRIKTVTQSDGTALAFTYSAEGKVETVTDALNRVVRFDYTVPGQTKVTDPLGNATVYEYDAKGQLSAVTAPAINGISQVSRFQYDADGNVTRVTAPSGLATVFEYDANGNRVLERDAAGNTVTRHYDAATNRLLSETLYAVADPDGAGAGAAGGAMTRYQVYDGMGRLHYAVSAQGAVTEYRYNANNQVASELRYTGTFYNVPSNTLALSESFLNTWVASVADRTQIARNDFAYDFRGQVQRSTRFERTDAAGEGIVDGSQSVTEFVRDHSGMLLQTIVGNGVGAGAVTTWTYDGLGRQLSEIDAHGTRKISTYDALSNLTVSSTANGASVHYAHNNAGEIISVQHAHDGVTGTVRNYYDGAGRLRMVKDELGQTAHTLYDAAGRKVGSVVNGTLTELVYDADNRLVRTVTYLGALRAALVDLSGNPREVKLEDVRPTANAGDRSTWSSYDAAGRLSATVDANGYLTRMEYDGAGRLVRTTARSKPVDLSLLSGGTIPASIAGEAGSDDRVQRRFYDRDGNLAGSLAADGVLTTHRYNAGGLLAESTTHLVLTDPAKRTDGALAELVPASGAKAISRNFYDGKNQLVGTLDAENYLTEFDHDAAGNVTFRRAYALQVGNPSAATLEGLGKRNDAADRIVYFEYTALNQLRKEFTPGGSFTTYEYDAAGNATTVTRGIVSAEQRTETRRYTETGRIAAELNAEGTAKLRALGATPAADAVAALWAAHAVSYTYDLAGNRTSVTDPLGNRTHYLYENGRLVATINPMGELEERRYNKLGELVLVSQFSRRLSASEVAAVAAAGKLGAVALDKGVGSHTKYFYDKLGRLTYTVNADGAVQEQRYNAFNQAVQSVLYRGRAVVTDIVANEGFGGSVPVELASIVSQPAGSQRATSYFDARGRLQYSVGASGVVTGREYDAQGNLSALIHYGATADANALTGNGSEKAGLAALSQRDRQRYSYSLRGLVTDSVDAMGNHALSEYNAFGDNVKTTQLHKLGTLERSALDAVTQTLYDNEGRVRASVDASGAVTAFSYDSAGRVTEQVTFARTVAAGATAAEIAAQLDSNSLSDVARDARDRFIYDANGNLSVKMRLQTAAGGGTAWMLQAHYYDQNGRLLERLALATPMPAAGANPSDAAVYQFLQAEQNRGASDARVRFAYDAAGRTVASATAQRDANGAAQWSVVHMEYDAKGQLLQRAARLNLLTASAPDGAAMLAVAPHADDSVVRYQYDAVGRVAATATALGGNRWSVAARNYDAAGNLLNVTQYATPLQGALPPADIKAAVQSNPAQDRTTRYGYDAANRLVFTIDGAGTVSRNEYDVRGNVVATRLYATRTNLAGDIPAGFAPLANGADRVSQVVYDLNNRPVYEIDANRALVHTRYDALGNVMQRTSYATKLAAMPPLSASVDSIVAPASQNDRSERFAYDQEGRLRFAVDALGYVTETRYDAQGRVLDKLVYGSPSSIAAGSDEAFAVAVQQFASANASSAAVVSYGYDAAGNLVSATDELRKTETYGYDALGRRTSFTNKANNTWTYKFDAAGHMVEETSPKVTAHNGSGLATFGNWPAATLVAMVTRMEYDALGNLVKRIEAADIPEKARVTEYRYDTLGRQVQTIQSSVAIYDTAAAADSNARTEKASGARIVTVSYDSMGNAVSNRDVAGGLSYKVYDRMGRVAYEIDAEGYVTGYERDTFGAVAAMTRYNGKPAAAPAGKTFADLSADQFRLLVNSNAGADRTLRTEYDQLGRVIRVREPLVEVYEHRNTNGVVLMYAGRVTETEYDAFGGAQRVAVYGADANNNKVSEEAVSYTWFNRRGEKTATVQALSDIAGQRQGYLTEFTYDAAGNLTNRYEYATAYGAWSTASAGTPPAKVANDRHVGYAYDKANRLESETRVNVTYAQSNSQADLVTGNLVTAYAYDAVGNRIKVTDALKGTTYTYFDALGRTIATGKTQSAAVDGVQDAGAVLTEFKLDIHGNTVMAVDHAASPVELADSGYLANADLSKARVTATRYDAWGRALEILDAQQFQNRGSAVQLSYDIFGRVAKQWRSVSNVDGLVSNAFELKRYDAVGRLVEVVTPELADLVDFQANGMVVKGTSYNAFGEVTGTTVRDNVKTHVTSVTRYNQAGQAWLTNSGDGVYKVMYYDVAGNTTSLIRSASSDVNALANLQSAGEVWGKPQLLRTDTYYNLLGHQTSTTLYSAAVALVRRDGRWQREEAHNTLAAGGLLVVGDISDAGKSVRVRYRVGNGSWIDAPTARVERIDGVPVFNTVDMPSGEYTYQVLERPVNQEEFVRSGGAIKIVSATDETKDRQIIQMYMMMFNRVPNMEEINYWINGSNQGISPSGMLAFMLQSAEGSARLLGTSREIIQRIFTEGLRITAANDPAYGAKVDKWSALLERAGTGFQERALVLADLLQSVNAAGDAPSTLFVGRSKALENYVVAQRGTNAAIIAEFMASATPDADIARGTAVGSEERYRMQLAGLYAAVFGRAPTYAELDFYARSMLNNTPLAAVAENFLSSPEGLQPDMYPARESNDAYYRQLVSRVYAKALNRAPTSTELETAVAALNLGTLSRAKFIVDLTERVSRYEGSDAAQLADRNLFNNKIAVTLAIAKPNTTFDSAVGRMLLQSVTADASAQDAVQKALLTVQATAQLAQMNATIGVAAAAMPVEAARRTLARLYILVLNRLPDQHGMTFYLSTNPSTPAQWEAIAQGMLNSSEAATALGNWSGLSADAFVKKLYAQLAGSLPNGSNALTQLDGYTAAITGGKSRAAVVVDMARTMLDLADLNATDRSTKSLLDNRTAVAVTTGLYLPLSSAAQSAVLTAVTTTDIAAALAQAYTAASTDIKAKLTALRSDETAANVLAASINAVVSANTTAVSAAATLNGNAEAKLRLQMTEMYVGLLGRSPTNPPDVAGMQFYIDNGASLEAIAQGFITSSEGNALYGGLSNQQFVDKVYTTMLGSTSAISQGVRDGWVAKLAGANPPTRSKVAFDILNAVLGHHATNVDPVNAGLAAARSTFLLKVSDTYVKVEEKLNAEITRLSNLVGTLKTTADNLAAQLPSLQSTRDSTESTRASTASAATTALNGATAGDGRGVARLEVARLYGALLQRTTSNPPTLADLNLYAPYPLDQVAQWLLDSSEGRAIFPAGSTNTAFVNQLYLKVMGRAADTAGLNFWVNYLNNNASVANVRGKAAVEMMKGFMSYSDNKPAELTYKKTFDDKIASFLSTANSQASSAVTTAQNNVNYVNSLLAAIQQAQYDKTYWEGQVQSRSAAAAEGQEIIDKATARGTVSMIYGQLRGSYDYGGALFWIRQIHTTPSHSDTLISGLISEYPQANADFVKQLYSRVLSRTPSAAEVNWYVDLLNRGVVTKLAVAKDFMASPEGQGLMPAKKAAVETPLLNTAKAAVQAKTDAQTEVNKAITRLNTANSNYANCGMTQASANAALSAAQNAAAAMSAVVAAHPKVITADNAAITAANARVAYETKYAEWQAADTAYRNALNDPLRTKYSTAASLSAMIKNAASSRATLAQATATATANGAANVNGARVHQLVQLYVTVLNRAPTTAELLNALESLKASKPFNDVAKTLLQGSTYVGLSDDAFVTKLYAFAFSPTRPLGADEKKFWLDQLTAGVSREELVARFLRSTNDGGNSDTKTLNDRTITILNGLVAVPITDAETDKAIADSAAAARMALANGDAAGLAALEASPDGKRVMELAKLYQAIFNRAPDAPGLAFYLNALRSATPPSYEAIANALLVSAEGAAIFPATLSNADFVNKVFLSSFGRAATEGEKSLYGGQLATQSRGKVVQNIVEAVFKYPASDIAMLGAQARLHSNLAGNFAALQLDAQAYSNTANTAAALLSAAATAKVATLYTAALKIANSQTVTITQAGRRGTAMTTDRWGNVLSITDPRNPNYKVFYQYNHDNQQIDQTVYALGTGGGAAHAATRYDALGRIAATVDFRGNKNSYGFDSNGNMVKEYHADGSIVSSAYNLFGDRTSVEHPGSYGSVVRTEYEFDYLGRMTRSSSQNVMVTYSDHWKGDMGRKFIGFKQLNEYYRYDEMGQRIAVEYDEYSEHLSGAPVRTLLSKTYFDLAGNTIGTVNGGGFGTYSRFNALGQKTAEKDATNRRMSWTHDDFGRVLKHTDKGGAEVRYSYNALGQQTYLDSDVRAGYGKQEIEQVYEGGLLARIIDRGTKTETRYTYDLTGRRLTEQTAIVGADGLEELVQNNRISYDAQGRMSHVEDGRFKVDFEYDNNGNRVRVQTQYQDNAGKAVSTDVHSTYDVMNRALIINGSKVGNDVVIGTDGHRITYDDAGRRKSDTYMYKNQVTGNIEQTTEYFYYDNAGRLDQVVRDGVVVERRYYDELGRVIQTGPQENANADRLKAFGIPAVIQVYAYDSAGNLARMKSWTLGAKMLDDMYYRYKPTEGSGYDAAGTLHHHYVVSNSGVHTLTSNSHVYFDSAKEIQVTANRDGTIAHTFTQLDANGNVVGVSDTGAVKKNRTFINDAAGRVLRTTQDGKVTHTMIVNGEVFGSNSDTAVAANFGSAYQSALSGANTAAPTIYNVQSDGENLRSIAKQIWGDATLWYLIADANNLDADSALAVGQILKIPPRINTVHNDAETFNPYNASEAIGDTRPTLPEPKAKKGCGGVGQIVMIVVAVVATIYTGGAAAGLFMGQGAAALGFSAAMTMGTSLATAGLSFATVGGAIVGGALGSLASQAVGIAIGAQEKFNWKAVGMSALSAGMAPGGSALSSVVGTVASQAVTQAVASKLGLIEHFSWRNVAASVVGSMAGEAAGGAIKGSPIGQYIGKFGADFAKSVTRNAVSAAIGPQSFNWKDIATDAFGNALGQSLAAQIGGDSESRLAQQRRHARQAIASGGVDYIADKLIAGGMGIMEATVRSRSDAMQDTVGIIQSMNAAEQAAGVDFESLPVEQQNAILRGALANNSRSGPMLTEQLSRREAIVEAVDGGGYEGIPRLPDLAPVSIIGAVDLKTSFVRTGANVLDRTNGAVVELVNVVGQENATAAAFGIQLAVGGIPRTALSYAGNYILGGAKEDLSRKLSNLIADKGFDVQSAKPELASKIQIVSDALGRFGVEAAFSGASQFVHSAIDSRRMLNAAGVVGNTKTPEIGSKVNPGRVFWKDQIEFNGIKVYQRGDSFDPNKMTTWRQGGKVISGTNIERMATGRAPIGTDGKPVNLHHMTQSNDSAIAEMTQTFHQQNSKVIHINPNTIPSGIDRPAFDAWKARYWTDRAKNFGQ